MEAINDLESRTADLRHIEAELEAVRQAHYTAGDQVNQCGAALRGDAEVLAVRHCAARSA